MFSCLWRGRRCLIEVVVNLCMTGRGPLDMHPIGKEGGVMMAPLFFYSSLPPLLNPWETR